MLIQKEGSKLIFNSDKGCLEYDFKDCSYIKNGRKNKSANEFFRNTSIQDFKNGCNGNYKVFIEKVLDYRRRRYSSNLRNIGSILEVLPKYDILESWIMGGFENVDCDIKVKLKDVNKHILKFIKKFNLRVNTGILLSKYKDNIKIINIIKYLTEHEDEEICKRMFDIINDYYKSNNLMNLIDNHKYNEVALTKYLINIHRFEAFDMYEAVSELSDYYNMASVIHRNGKAEKYPKCLKTTHDITARNYRNNKEVYDEELFKMKVDNNLEYIPKNGKYLVIAPKSSQDIKQEGVDLTHCVASYIKNIMKGETQIMFIRHKDNIDKSLVTLEVKNDTLCQARGYFNQKPNEEESIFIQQYAKNKNLNIMNGVI